MPWYHQALLQGACYPCLTVLWSKWAPPGERSKLANISFAGKSRMVHIFYGVISTLACHAGVSALHAAEVQVYNAGTNLYMKDTANLSNEAAKSWIFSLWASYQIYKLVGCACAGNAGNVFPRHRGLAIPPCITARAWRTWSDACLDR